MPMSATGRATSCQKGLVECHANRFPLYRCYWLPETERWRAEVTVWDAADKSHCFVRSGDTRPLALRAAASKAFLWFDNQVYDYTD